ncbi:MAG: hypothetical protein E3K32_02670 [wastewater metagenome]|nr:hypothetical protein [Candidatus Loosdrechtia aerotolerans]
MSRRSLFSLSVLHSLLFFVITYVSIESLTAEKAESHSRGNNFQRVVHGLGLGATTKPTWCYINFDPRVDPRCPCIEWPVPGGFCYCPEHTGTVSYIAGNVEMGIAIETKEGTAPEL